MNIQKLIMSLQQAATASTTSLDLMIISKAIEKLRVGSITTVATLANLPTTLTTNGNIYYVTAEEDIYYNVGSTWKGFYTASTQAVAYGWGRNISGQIGDNTTVSKSSPVTAVGGITTWSQVSTGFGHSAGVTTAGVAYAWGNGSYGELGDGTNVGKSSPVTVVGGITTWAQVAAAVRASIGRTSGGVVYAWGRAAYGMLGDNQSASNRSSPVTVVGGITTWTNVTMGKHAGGVTSGGIAYAWGHNSSGQIGDNTTVSKSSPVTVVGGITTWSQLSAGATGGAYCMFGRTAGGLAYAWGRGSFAELGDGSYVGKSSPVLVLGGVTNWSFLAGDDGGCGGLTSTGLAYGWGSNSSGQIGDNTSTTRTSATLVAGGITNWTGLSKGNGRTLGLTSSGVLYSWGANFQGQLGDGVSTTARSSPVTVVGGFTTWKSVGVGGYRTSVAILAGKVNNPQG